MTDPAAKDRGWRGSRERWLQAAHAALIDGGVDAVRILPLAARLGLSRTSFYWFFKDRADLLDGLRDRWAGTTTTPLLAAADAYAETGTEAMLNVIACFLSARAFDARLEFALRSWALQDGATMAALHRADEDRLAALIAMLRRWGHAPDDAEVRARTVYLTQVGYIAMQTVETLETRLARVPGYVAIFTGAAPAANEMARFAARLQADQAMTGGDQPA